MGNKSEVREKISALRKSDIADIQKKLDEVQSRMLHDKLAQQTGQERDLNKVKKERKEIARLLTILREKQFLEGNK